MGPRLPLVRGDGGLVHALDHGDEEAEGLAGAGGGGGEDVVAFERGRDGPGLDGGGGDEAGGGEAGLEGVGDLEVVEVDIFDQGRPVVGSISMACWRSGAVVIGGCWRSVGSVCCFKSCGVQEFSFWCGIAMRRIGLQKSRYAWGAVGSYGFK